MLLGLFLAKADNGFEPISTLRKYCPDLVLIWCRTLICHFESRKFIRLATFFILEGMSVNRFLGALLVIRIFNCLLNFWKFDSLIFT